MFMKGNFSDDICFCKDASLLFRYLWQLLWKYLLLQGCIYYQRRWRSWKEWPTLDRFSSIWLNDSFLHFKEFVFDKPYFEPSMQWFCQPDDDASSKPELNILATIILALQYQYGFVPRWMDFLSLELANPLRRASWLLSIRQELRNEKNKPDDVDNDVDRALKGGDQCSRSSWEVRLVQRQVQRPSMFIWFHDPNLKLHSKT